MVDQVKKIKIIIIVHEININVTSLEQKESRALNNTSLDHPTTPDQNNQEYNRRHSSVFIRVTF